MLRKLSSIKKRYFVIPIAVVIVIAAAAIIWSLRQKDTLDFSDFTREEEQYCYQNIPWGIDPETAEKQLKRTLEQLPSTPTYYDAGIINAGGYKGSFRAEFEEGKRLITVEISFPREMDDTSVDYSEIESEALEAFKKRYGEETRKNDSMGIDGLYHRNTSWYSRNEDGQVTILTVQASHNTQRVVDLMVVTGVVPPEIWERVQKEGNLNNAAEQEESTDMPNHKNVENPSEQIKPSSTPQEQTSTSETQGKIAISLKELKDGEGFGFGDTWNLSLEETEEKLGMELEPLSEVGNVKNYRISDDVYLVEAERDAMMGLQFIDEKMQMIALIAEESDSNVREELYQKLSAELKNLYGEPDRSGNLEGFSERISWMAESGEEVTTMMCENNGKAEEVAVAIGIVP